MRSGSQFRSSQSRDALPHTRARNFATQRARSHTRLTREPVRTTHTNKYARRLAPERRAARYAARRDVIITSTHLNILSVVSAYSCQHVVWLFCRSSTPQTTSPLSILRFAQVVTGKSSFERAKSRFAVRDRVRAQNATRKPKTTTYICVWPLTKAAKLLSNDFWSDLLIGGEAHRHQKRHVNDLGQGVLVRTRTHISYMLSFSGDCVYGACLEYTDFRVLIEWSAHNLRLTERFQTL